MFLNILKYSFIVKAHASINKSTWTSNYVIKMKKTSVYNLKSISFLSTFILFLRGQQQCDVNDTRRHLFNHKLNQSRHVIGNCFLKYVFLSSDSHPGSPWLGILSWNNRLNIILSIDWSYLWQRPIWASVKCSGTW